MLFALYFYVMSGSMEIDKFYTVVGSQMDCHKAMQSVEFGSTGGLALELECSPYPSVGLPATKINQFDRYTFIMASYSPDSQLMRTYFPDAASCSNRITEKGKFYSNTPTQFIGVCFPGVK